MNTAAMWIGWASMIGGGIALACLCLWLAVEGAWRVWHAVTGFFNIVEAWRDHERVRRLATDLHYPECWDTAAYPTVGTALSEVVFAFRCTNDDCAHAGSATHGVDSPDGAQR